MTNLAPDDILGILSAEICGKYKQYCFKKYGVGRPHDGVYFSLDPTYNGSTTLSNIVALVAPCGGGAYHHVGTIDFHEDHLKSKMRSVWGHVRRESKFDTFVFDYADPNFFDQVHEHFKSLGFNFIKLNSIITKRYWANRRRR